MLERDASITHNATSLLIDSGASFQQPGASGLQQRGGAGCSAIGPKNKTKHQDIHCVTVKTTRLQFVQKL